VHGRVGQQRQILPEQLHRNPSGVLAGPLGDGDQPRIIRTRFRCR
jgi:hypothetical protein